MAFQTMSDELFAPVGTGVELCYQTFGSPDAEPLLLVMGLAGPMTWWPQELCEQLADRGFYVIRFDNRDAGRSTVLREHRVGRSAIIRAFAGLPVRAPYAISDLADDAAGLLDHLGIASAHVVGMSMGGMVAQTIALRHPERVRSLTSIMSTTGRRTVGWQHPKLIPTLLRPAAPGEDGYVANNLITWRMISSTSYPPDRDELESRARETYQRGVSASGVLRQMLAILTQPDRTRDLARLTVPTAVIHGLADKMVHVSGGRATAAAVPDSALVLIDGMGHDLPEPLWPQFVATIERTAARAR